MAEYETENKQIVKNAEQSLFTLFKKEIADNVTVSPQYMEQRIQEVNAELWTLTRHFFEQYNESHSDNCYEIDEQAQTVTATGELSILFYYWSGSRNKPYQSLRRYGMDMKFKPASGKITLSILSAEVFYNKPLAPIAER